LQLTPHDLVFLCQLGALLSASYSDDFLEFTVLFFEDKELLVHVVSTSFALQIQNILQMLDLFLKLDHKSVISGANLIG